MKIALRSCLIVALAGVALLGQTKPKDVDGWDKIKWGMTIEEVRAIYNAKEQPEVNEYWTLQKLGSVKISDIDMNVYAMAKHGSEHIVRVKLERDLHGQQGPSATYNFDTLKTLLIQKYGLFVSDETKKEFGGSAREVRWMFPSASILLTLNNIALTVDYIATDKKALDVL
jgi:hypothetical protein